MMFPTRRPSSRFRQHCLLSAVAAAGLLAACHPASAAIYNWDPGMTGSSTGTGTWDPSAISTLANWYNGSADVTWANLNATSADTANFNTASAASTVTLASDVVSHAGLAFGKNYTVGTSSGPSLTLDQNGSVYVPSATATIAAPFNVTATGGLVKTGTYDLALNGPVNVTNYSISGNGRVILNSSATLSSGSAAITKSGSSNLLVYMSPASPTWSGDWTLSGGAVELGGNAKGLGLGAVNVQTGATLSINTTNGALPNNINLADGGTLGVDYYSDTVTILGQASGAITVADGANATFRLGNFFSSSKKLVNDSLTLTSASTLSGHGTITLAPGYGGSNKLSDPNGQVLSLLGNNSAFTGTLVMASGVAGGYSLVLGSALGSGATIAASSTPTSLTSILLNKVNYLPTITVPTGYVGTTGGVLAYTGGALTPDVDESTLGDGYWFIGAPAASFLGTSTSGGGSFWTSNFKPGANNTYRLGGGGGALFVGNPVLKDYNGGHTSLLIGDSRPNGGGTVRIASNATYTGPTTLANGILQLMNNASLANSNISIGAGTTLRAEATGGSLIYNLLGDTADLISDSGTLDLTNLSLIINASGQQTVGSYTIANINPGATLTGTFKSISYVPGDGSAPSSLPDGWTVTYNPSSIVLTTPVPEPTTLGLASLAGLGFLSRRRRA